MRRKQQAATSAAAAPLAPQRNRNHRRKSKSQSSPETKSRVGEELIDEHGIEITDVERRKKMAKEVGSGGVETKENERSTKKSKFRGHLRVSLI